LAAAKDGISIDINKIIEPKTTNHLVIEGAGGLLVPLNENDCIIDLIQKDYKVILVSRHYLGSINHTLLSFEALKSRKIQLAGIIFSGDENKATEEIILAKTKAKFIGRIEEEPYFDANVIQFYADEFRNNLLKL
jgi:dethiobiotin synthetase